MPRKTVLIITLAILCTPICVAQQAPVSSLSGDVSPAIEVVPDEKVPGTGMAPGGGCGCKGKGKGKGNGAGGGCAASGAKGRGQVSDSPKGPGCRPEVMQSTHALVHQYRQDIVRQIEEIDNGVVTITRSPKNPEAVEVIQRHAEEMKGVLESGGRVRGWDPLFAEIFDHHEEIEMVIEPLDDGVRVIETSENPEVVKLIQAHAWKVNEFVARGPSAVHEETPLPEGYGDAGDEAVSPGS